MRESSTWNPPNKKTQRVHVQSQPLCQSLYLPILWWDCHSHAYATSTVIAANPLCGHPSDWFGPWEYGPHRLENSRHSNPKRKIPTGYTLPFVHLFCTWERGTDNGFKYGYLPVSSDPRTDTNILYLPYRPILEIHTSVIIHIQLLVVYLDQSNSLLICLSEINH